MLVEVYKVCQNFPPSGQSLADERPGTERRIAELESSIEQANSTIDALRDDLDEKIKAFESMSQVARDTQEELEQVRGVQERLKSQMAQRDRQLREYARQLEEQLVQMTMHDNLLAPNSHNAAKAQTISIHGGSVTSISDNASPVHSHASMMRSPSPRHSQARDNSLESIKSYSKFCKEVNVFKKL